MADPTQLLGLLTARGYSPVAAAGILGNLQQESSLNPAASGDQGTSYGLAQWHADRKQGLIDYARGQGASAADPGTQIGFLDQELHTKYPGVLASLQTAKTPQDAATAFLGFERPKGYTDANPMAAMGAPQRLANAASIFSGSGGAMAAPAQGMPQAAPAAAPAPDDGPIQIPQAQAAAQPTPDTQPPVNLGLSQLGQLQQQEAQRRQQLAGLLAQFVQGGQS